MRDDFRKAGCHYRVLKNSLVKIAVKGSQAGAADRSSWSAPTAVIWSNDESRSRRRKVALKWAKDEPKFKIKGGYFEGQVLDAKPASRRSRRCRARTRSAPRC